jgi:hypothetical protein
MRRASLVAVLAVSLLATPAIAQSKRGTWAGTSNTAQGTQPFTIVLDSTSAGWVGAAVAPMMNDSLKLVEISVRADTVEFGIPVNNTTVYISGLVSGDKMSGKIWMQNNSVGSVDLTRKPAASPKPPAGAR